MENRINWPPPEQAGFRPWFSTTDHLHTLDYIIEKSIEFHTPLNLAFVDYSKAFVSLHHCDFYIPSQLNVNWPDLAFNREKWFVAGEACALQWDTTWKKRVEQTKRNVNVVETSRINVTKYIAIGFVSTASVPINALWSWIAISLKNHDLWIFYVCSALAKYAFALCRCLFAC